MRIATRLGIAVLIVTSGAAFAQIYEGPVKPGDPLISYRRISQEFGVDWSENSSQTHTGIDLSAARGNRVFSVKQGVVYKVGNLGGKWGRYVVIFNRDGTSNGYLHVDPAVVEGDRVQRGQEIGTIYRDHLHLNQCKAADGCQHGAFPNPTFSKGSKSDVGKYYVRYKM